MIEEKDLKGDILVRTIDNLINDNNKLKEMKNNLIGFGIDNSANIIYTNLKKIIGENK